MRLTAWFLVASVIFVELLVAHEAWGSALVFCIPTDKIFVHFSKALDSVNHSCLLEQLKRFGLGIGSLTFIE